MSRRKPGRKRSFVDSSFQGALAARVVVYWAMCLLTVTLMLLCWRAVTGPEATIYAHIDDACFLFGPALIASLILLPLVVMDVVRTSNRVAGPVMRLRRAMRDLARGERVAPIRVRRGDFWPDLVADFNAVAAQVQGSAARAPRDVPPAWPAEEHPVRSGSI